MSETSEDLERAVRTLVIRKSVLAVVCGVILAIITSPIHNILGSPAGDALLLGLFAVSYFPITYVLCRQIALQGCLKKATTLYYSLEFLAWVATYEIIARLLT